MIGADDKQLGVTGTRQCAAARRVLEAPASLAALHLRALQRVQHVAPRHVLTLGGAAQLAVLLGGGVRLSVERHQESSDAQPLSGGHLLQPLMRLVDALDLQQRRVGAARLEANHLGGNDEVGATHAALVGGQLHVEVLVDHARRHLGSNVARNGPQHQGPPPHCQSRNVTDFHT